MKNNLNDIELRIRQAALGCGRDPASVRLVAVAKTKPVEKVREAIEAGVGIIGENYIQEAREKFNALGSHPVSWHFIGHLQSNKAKYAVRMFDLIHSVDSLKLARAIDTQAAKVEKIQDVLIQVNIAEEETKSGVSVESVRELVESAAELKHLRIKGLMTMPPFFDDPENARPFFRTARQIQDSLLALNIPNTSLEELSMGMTGDFEAD